jgi:hypothetical protein
MPLIPHIKLVLPPDETVFGKIFNKKLTYTILGNSYIFENEKPNFIYSIKTVSLKLYAKAVTTLMKINNLLFNFLRKKDLIPTRQWLTIFSTKNSQTTHSGRITIEI